MKTIEIINEQLNKGSLGIISLVSSSIIILCVFAIFVSILINFIEAKSKENVKRKKRSIVETGSMIGFFIVFYLILKFNICQIELENLGFRIGLLVLGLILIVLGCIVNISGRLRLGGNWANQVIIYKDQTLVTQGVYGIVRHPLYASLIWMFFGASFAYVNIAALLANLLVFIPFMYYRAKQEEKVLLTEFKNYSSYKKNVGMFFPKIFKR